MIDNVRYNSTENGREYHGVDLSFNARLRNGTQLQGGVTTGKLHEHICQVDDPNNLRYCDATYPFLTQFKLSGTYPLPYGFRVSGSFQSLPGVQSSRDGGNVGKDLNVTYSVGRAIAPGLTQTTVNVRLNEPGTVFLDRVNQVDFAISRDFQLGRAASAATDRHLQRVEQQRDHAGQHDLRTQPAPAGERVEPAADPTECADQLLNPRSQHKVHSDRYRKGKMTVQGSFTLRP